MRRSAFTLIELAIAMAIVGILATLSIPAYNAVVARAKRTEGLLMLKKFWEAEEAYYAEHGHWYPAATRTITILRNNRRITRAGRRGRRRRGRRIRPQPITLQWRYGVLFIPPGVEREIKELGLKFDKNRRYGIYFYWDESPWGTRFFYCAAYAPGGPRGIDGDRFRDWWLISKDGRLYCVADDITNTRYPFPRW